MNNSPPFKRHSVGRTYPWQVAPQQSLLPFRFNNTKFKSVNYIYNLSKFPATFTGISKEQYFKQLAEIGFESGTSVQGSLGQTLLPYPQGEGLSSTNDNIQVILNKKGTLNHRAIGVAHEFTHVVLHLKGLP